MLLILPRKKEVTGKAVTVTEIFYFIHKSWFEFPTKEGKVIDFTLPRTSSGQASRPYETVPIGTILSPSEGGTKPLRENHQTWRVKDISHVAHSRSRTQAIAVTDERVTTAPPRKTKTIIVMGKL